METLDAIPLFFILHGRDMNVAPCKETSASNMNVILILFTAIK